jgi:putative thioredoxin
MSNQNNPYGGNDGGYTTSVQFGATPAGSEKSSVEEQPRPSIDLGGEASAVASADLIKDTTTAAFTADVIQESRNQPVLVDFWAPWCGPCKQLTPALEKAVNAAGGRVKLVKMNIDDHPSIAGQLGIQSIPAVIAFKDGQPVDGFMGAIPESQLREFIEKVGGKGNGGERIAEALAAAAAARTAGDNQTALDIYQAVLEQAPETVEALAGVAGLMFDAGDKQAALDVLAQAPETSAGDPRIAAIRAKIALEEEAASLGDAAGLDARLAADPKDHQARFDLALIHNAEGRRDQAADDLLAIVKADRSWNDDGARAQLLKFFEAWGPMDEATLSARRKLSSLLFS